jgi:cysteine desulfurase/selenocysteine lyase
MNRFSLPGTARASFALYNTAEEVDVFATALRRVVEGAAARARPAAKSEPIYPKAAAASPAEAADELAEVFEFLEDWNDRYQYLIELGAKLPSMPAEMKTEANRVRGCQSTVYLAARQQPGSADVLEFLADSDTDLVRGLLAVLVKLFSGQRAGQVLAFDVEGFFARLGLDQHLTMGRRNGLAEMVKRVRGHAAALAARESP